MKQAEIEAVEKYVAEVAKLAKAGVTTEHPFRPALNALLQALAPSLVPVNDGKHYQRIILALAKTRAIMNSL